MLSLRGWDEPLRELGFELAGHVVNRVGLGTKRLLRDDSYTAADRDGCGAAAASRGRARASTTSTPRRSTRASPRRPDPERLHLAGLRQRADPRGAGAVPGRPLIATKVGPTDERAWPGPTSCAALVEADLRDARPRPPRPGLPAPGRAGLGGRALRGPGRAPAGRPDPAPRPLQRAARAPGAGPGDRAGGGGVEPVRRRLRPGERRAAGRPAVRRASRSCRSSRSPARAARSAGWRRTTW